MENELKLS